MSRRYIESNNAVNRGMTYSTMGDQPETLEEFIEYYEKLSDITEFYADKYGYKGEDVICAVSEMLHAKKKEVQRDLNADSEAFKLRMEALDIVINKLPKIRSCSQKARNALTKIYSSVMAYFKKGGRTKRSKRSKRSKSRRTRRTRR
jgi:hypothetical protein